MTPHSPDLALLGHRGAEPARQRARTGAARLALLSLAQLMVILDISAVNVALPDLAKDLGLSGGRLGWAITSYSLVFGSLLLLGGRDADVLGRRRLFLAGLGVFTVSSLASALAGSASVFFAARAGQGWAPRCSRPPRSRSSPPPSRVPSAPGRSASGRGGRRGRGGRGAARRDAHGVARLGGGFFY